ncbi:ThuA domain-containing protein [Pedobacter sp. HMF7647]|uniref:ThuA domain-containing protein n=1 Tax=Hufsiella arboris TaxID=2695275 RepID=A0A7K1YBR7_9SPHI|nr:ThuA domain-containing protein [Hufsiella arboris]MXV52052.1 ThuA domain-containing protein [Hufsiella arboris]
MKYKLILCILLIASLETSAHVPRFNVIAFFTGINDQAHVSFVREANIWFNTVAKKYQFRYDTTSNWNNLNDKFLSGYQVVLFLDTRPEKSEQRDAFQRYMENGGAWMGFHFSAFALTPSDYNQNWDWYHNQFLGSGQYGSNTWRPTSAILKVEDKQHAVCKKLPVKFKAAANEWYRWQNDLTKNKDIDILLAIDSTSFPLGTGPKQSEIWHSGYYPVAWTNKKYRMVYLNMGHNDMDYEHKFGADTKTLSHTFSEPYQNQFIINSLLWLAGRENNPNSAKNESHK